MNTSTYAPAIQWHVDDSMIHSSPLVVVEYLRPCSFRLKYE